MTAKQIVQSIYPDATIRRCESAFKRSIEYRITQKDENGNYFQVTGRNPSEAWVNAKNLIETIK